MKTLCYLILSGVALAAPDDKYSQVIYQVEYKPNGEILTEYPMTVEKGGSSKSHDPVMFKSIFDLYCLNNYTGVDTHIQRQVVKAYAPEANIVIETLDPYVDPGDGHRRTRVDKPYTVTYTVDGLKTNDPTAQDAARMVTYSIQTDELVPNSLSVEDGTTPVVNTSTVDKNGDETEGVAALPANSPGSLVSYSFKTLDDYGAASYTLGNEAKVYRFNLATGSISGIEISKKYKSLPDITLNIIGAYPGSDSFLRVKNLNTNEVYDVPFSHWINNDKFPEDKTWVVFGDELSDEPPFASPGRFKLCLMTSTEHYGERVIAEISPIETEANIINVNGTFTTAE